MQESQTGVIDLPEDDPHILTCFLQFLYTGNYEDKEHMPSEVPAHIPLDEGVTDPFAKYPEAGGEAESEFEPGESSRPQTEEYTEGSAVQPDELEASESGGEDAGEDDGEDAGEDAGEDSGEDSDDDERERPEDMFTSLRVYVMADKFDVPGLKRLSRARLWSTMRRVYLKSSDLPALVEELYETTAETDYATREMPCRLLAPAYANDWMDMAPMEEVMRRQGDLAVGILKFTKMYYKGSDVSYVTA